MSSNKLTQIEIRFLGDFQFSIDGKSISDNAWKRKTARTIIKILILNGPNIVTIDQLIEACEAHSPSNNNRQTIYSRISDIRHLLEPNLKRATQSEYITRKGNGYAFSFAGECWIDIEEFKTHIESATQFEENRDWEQAMSSFKQAISLYAGDFLGEDLYEEWTQPFREQYRCKFLSCLERMAALCRQKRHLHESLEYINQAIKLESHHERLYQEKMELQALLGQKEQALDTFQEFHNIADTYLGATPSTETYGLYKQISQGKIEPALPQILHNLPKQLNSFVGRDRELHELLEHLEKPGCHLLTILGPGGVGKTRLAIEFGHRLLKHKNFVDGIYYISLGEECSEASLIQLIAEAMRADFFGQKEIKEQLLDQLKYKQCLLIIDAFELWLSQTGLIEEILRNSEDIKIIVTSRERLRLAEAWIHRLEGLDSSKNSEAERLFVERSAQMGINRIDKQNIAHVRQICSLCEGLPLAIELAASLTRVMECKRIWMGIRENIQILKSPYLNQANKHRSMNAVFNQTLALCRDEERETFLKLTLFKEGFTEEAALFVASASISTLLVLVDKSMIFLATNGSYRIHDLLRQFGKEELYENQDLTVATQRLHAEYFGKFLTKRARDVEGPKQRAVLRTIEKEIKNIYSAWDWSLKTKHFSFLELCSETIFQYFEYKMLYSLGRSFFSKTFDLLSDDLGLDKPGAKSCALLAKTMRQLGHFEMRVGQHKQAKKLLKRALEIFKGLNDRNEQMVTAATLANTEAYLGDKESAFELARKIELDLNATKAHSNQLKLQNTLAFIYYRFGEYERAIDTLTESLANCDLNMNPASHLSALGLLGNIYYYRGNYIKAKEYWQACLDHGARTKHFESLIAHNLGLIGVATGNYQEAQAALRRSYLSSTQIGHQVQRIYSLETLVEIAIAEGDIKGAQEMTDNMMEISEKTRNSHVAAQTNFSVGCLSLAKGQFQQAIESLQIGLKIQEALEDQLNSARSLHQLAIAFDKNEEFEKSCRTFWKAVTISDEIQSTPLMLNIFVDIAKFLNVQGKKMLCLKILNFVLSQSELEKRQEPIILAMIESLKPNLDQE